MKKAIIIAFLLLPALGFCQEYINQSHTDVLASLHKYKGEKPQLTETDSTIIMKVKGAGSMPVTYTYSFDRSGKCFTERVVAACDSCYKVLVQAILKKERYQWKKINENQYISRFEDKMTLEMPVEKTEYYYIVLRTDWTRTLYDMLTGK